MVDLDFPFRGEWIVRNSPADRVPSHGTTAFASSHAIDFVPVIDGRSAPFRFATLWRPEPPDTFPGFGRALLAPLNGVVVEARDGEPDHDAFRGLPSIGYALGQRGRAARGWTALAGNVVLIEGAQGVVVALCHLQRHSLRVVEGQGVSVGDLIGGCGNSGNSTEPHVHVQAMTGRDPRIATPEPVSFRGGLPRNGEVVRIP